MNRELTLKETNTATLQARLDELMRMAQEQLAFHEFLDWPLSNDDIERELEERNETEQKVSRW